MKKLKLIMALLLATPLAYAQPTEKDSTLSEEIEIEVDGNTVVIETEKMGSLSELDLNKLIGEVSRRSAKIMAQREELIAEVNEREARGEIDAEQAEEMREMIDERTEESMERIGELMEAWGESYEARMEAWEEQFEADMEAWEEKVERLAEADPGNFTMPPLPPLPPVPPLPEGESRRRVIIGDKGIIIRESEEGDEPFAFRFESEEQERHDHHNQDEHKDFNATDGYFDINFGFNQQLLGGSDFVSEGPQQQNFWSSNVFELGLGAKTRIGAPTSVFYIKYGGEISWHDFRLTDNNILMEGADSVMFGESLLYENVNKSKYKIAYINLPLMLQLDFSAPGERDEAFTLGLGGYAGLRISAKRKLEYRNSPYNEIEEEAKSDFFTNQFRYGLMTQIGFNSFKVTAKYDLNNFFRDNRGPEYQMASLSLGWTL